MASALVRGHAFGHILSLEFFASRVQNSRKNTFCTEEQLLEVSKTLERSSFFEKCIFRFEA